MEHKTVLLIKGNFIDHPNPPRAQEAGRLCQTLFSIAQFIEGSITLGEDKYLEWTMVHTEYCEINILLGKVSLMQEGNLTLSTVPDIRIVGENVKVGLEEAVHPFHAHSNIARQLKAE